MCLCETWLNHNIKTHELIFNGFKVYRNEVTSKRGGGLCFLIKNNIISSFHDSLQSDSIEMLHISYDNQSLFSKHIILIYRPLYSSLAQFYEQLDNILDKCDSKTRLCCSG